MIAGYMDKTVLLILCRVRMDNMWNGWEISLVKGGFDESLVEEINTEMTNKQ